MPNLLRLLPLALILVLLGLGYVLGGQDALGWASLARHEAMLRRLVAENPAAMAGGFVAAYVMAVALSFPGAVIFTVTGGLLFGTVAGAALAVCGATGGSAVIFLLARSAFAPALARRAGPGLDRMRAGMARNAFSYIVALRLIPVVPFWLVNLTAAALGMRLLPFLAGTLLGIIPATAIFASVGAGLGTVLARGARPDLTIILSPSILLPLLGLAALALLPVAWRAWRGRDGVEKA